MIPILTHSEGTQFPVHTGVGDRIGRVEDDRADYLRRNDLLLKITHASRVSCKNLFFAISFLRFEAHLNRALCGGSF